MPTTRAVVSRTSDTPTFFATPADFRRWLSAHVSSADSLTVGFHRVGSGTPCMTWPESVDEALCVGWIDGVRKRIDESAYLIRFTPRRKGSIWSTVNIGRVAVLTSEGRMTAGGLAAFALRIERKSSVYAYEQSVTAALTPDEIAQFKRRVKAWRWFEAVAPSYRKVMLHWVTTAKQAVTRERRLTRLIESCDKGERLQ